MSLGDETGDIDDEENDDDEQHGKSNGGEWEADGEFITRITLEDSYTLNDSSTIIEDTYITTRNCKLEGMYELNHRIVGAWSSLGDANKAAQGCLEQEHGSLYWDRYKERLLNDGSLCIRAQGNANKDKYSTYVTKTTFKRHVLNHEPERYMLCVKRKEKSSAENTTMNVASKRLSSKT